MKFIATGGGQRKQAVWSQEWKHYERALALSIDWDTGDVERVVEYNSPRDVIASSEANIVFKAGSLIDGKLYCCTQTEVLVYAFPSMEQVDYISLPCFNDLHHVTKVGDLLAVVSTGLDLLVMLDEKHNIVSLQNALGKDPWHRFSSDIDYRKEITTKPHESHPNYVFTLGDEVWVSRFEQQGAVCISDQSKTMDIGIERIHDGIVHGDFVYFTTVNGTVVKVDATTHKTVEVHDLNEVYKLENPLGWCRSLHIEDDRFFIGFSAIRSTKVRENLAWIKSGFKDKIENKRALPTRIVEYDPSSRTITKELELSNHGLDAVFSIMRCD